jgi:hypothetical protein
VIPLIPRITSLEAAMMGRQTGDQASLFYEFRLADRIPKDHLLQHIKGAGIDTGDLTGAFSVKRLTHAFRFLLASVRYPLSDEQNSRAD